jgi:DinB superfamily
VVKIEPIVRKMDRAQKSLLGAAHVIPAGHWKTCPREGSWSAAEVIAHVIMVERAVLGAMMRILQKEPKHVPLLKRFRLPMILGEVRFVRLKTPIPVDGQMVREKEEMLAELGETRGRTLKLMEETSGRDLSVYRWRHPFLGYLNAYGWFELLASHQIRHEKQLREIAARLRKAIANSQK